MQNYKHVEKILDRMLMSRQSVSLVKNVVLYIYDPTDVRFVTEIFGTLYDRPASQFDKSVSGSEKHYTNYIRLKIEGDPDDRKVITEAGTILVCNNRWNAPSDRALWPEFCRMQNTEYKFSVQVFSGSRTMVLSTTDADTMRLEFDVRK